MVLGEPVAELIRAKFAQSERRRVGDQESKDASTCWPRPDGLLFRLTQPSVQELLKTRSGLVEHTEAP